MKRRVIALLVSVATGFPAVTGAAPAPRPAFAQVPATEWIGLTDGRLEVRGLPWLGENTPDLWRLPKSAQTKVPKRAWARALAPDGGRIRFSCNSTLLGIRVQLAPGQRKKCFFDAFVNGEYAGSVSPVGTQRVDLVFFENKDPDWKDITIYLPHRQEVRVFAVGVEADAEMKPPPAFALKRPMVCYGSSVLQGSGAAHPSRTYPATVARRLNLDFVNLGFGGAGKAEAAVVGLVNQLDACCYLFDLGKSYGAPTPDRFNRMLDTIRASHPEVPIFCVTPIYSTREETEPALKQRSEELRSMMRRAAMERRQAGDRAMYVVEGLYLFGEPDKALFADALHPNDGGNERMAERLAPLIEKAVLGGEQAALGNPASSKPVSGTNAIPGRVR